MLAKAAEKFLNISSHELAPTAYAWFVFFLQRTGFIIGWTTMIAFFVTRFSIIWLPAMLLVQAILMMVGMVVFSTLSDRLPSKYLMSLCAFCAGLLLFVSTFFVQNDLVFFGLLLIVTGIFIPQLTIFTSHFVEDFFTPLECERTFPVIESSQTLGGIFGGLLLISLNSFIGSYKFFYLWIFFLFLMATVVFFLEPARSEHANLQDDHAHQKTNKPFFEKMKGHFKEIKAVPFLQGLLIIFLFHWVIGQLLEFQYTKVIDEAITNNLTSAIHEQALADSLGSFQILFHASALIVQLLIASRVLRSLGTVGSFLLHAFVTFLSSLSLILGFGFFTVILAKNNYELSGIIHKNAYDYSYYALRHGTQRKVREFFEALLYPLATIIGTVLLFSVQYFFLPEHSFPVLQVIIFFLAILMILFTFQLQKYFTDLSKDNLLRSENRLSKLHAIEILSQKSHQHNLEVLLCALKRPQECLEVKEKILQVFGEFHNMKALPALLEYLKSPEPSLVLASVLSIANFANLGENVFEQSFSRYQVINELKNTFLSHKDEKVRVAVVKALANLHYDDIVPFLLEVLQGSSPALQSVCLKVCSIFHDISLGHFVEPFLRSKNPYVEAHAIQALWQFKAYRKRLSALLKNMFHSHKREDLLAYCSIIGDMGDSKERKRLRPFLVVIDPELKLYASYALLKLGYWEAAPNLVHLLFSRNSVVLSKAKELLQDLKPELRRSLNVLIHKEVSARVNDFLMNRNNPVSSILNTDTEFLQRCKDAYLCVGSYHEADYVDSLIRRQIQHDQKNNRKFLPSTVQLLTSSSPLP